MVLVIDGYFGSVISAKVIVAKVIAVKILTNGNGKLCKNLSWNIMVYDDI